ncbi:hypothetical protein CEXT_151401 [Caerostris extrusa]|uniref:Uncharacterized protein n=1 Tax=Caerostris extrusa TaxID=172846 RepID=A0AAV4M7Y3_CAEEX|nr:hypothetical protein CEXT_151401 [Caerostris extrusa]
MSLHWKKKDADEESTKSALRQGRMRKMNFSGPNAMWEPGTAKRMIALLYFTAGFHLSSTEIYGGIMNSLPHKEIENLPHKGLI